MSLDRRSFHRALVASAALGTSLGSSVARASSGAGGGLVFTSTNSASGNELLVFGTDASGTLSLRSRLMTGGLGSGAGLGSQGAVTLSDDGRTLFVVNAGSHTVSSFVIRNSSVHLTAEFDAGGLSPISVSEREGLVYVLNAGGGGNVAGFHHHRGTLTSVAGSTRPLSAAGGTGPAQVSIGPEGDVLVVTEKNTNRLTSYALKSNGSASAPLVTPSAGLTPFGFTFDRRNRLLVSEAQGGAANASSLSSYRFDPAAPARPVAVSRAVPTGQTAACWAVVTPNGRHVYTANAGSGSVSHFDIDRRGGLVLVNGVAGSTGLNSGPVDMAIGDQGRSLQVLAGRVQTIFVFEIADDGTLSPAGSVAGLPVGSVGLAAS
jgi:6-phosphogluconolactonase (cycloisomerase 2 family)